MSNSREGQGKVKNRAPAAFQVSSLLSTINSTTNSIYNYNLPQITAEQLLREAADFQETSAPKPRQRVEDYEELNEYRGRMRQEFEEVIRRTRGNVSPTIR